MSNKSVDHLEPLSKSSHKNDHEQPTVDDWKIVDHTGQQIGTVFDLLYDREAKKVRYIITNLKNGELLKEDRLVLMPVGRARLNRTENEVVVPNVTKDQLSALPDYLTTERLSQQDEYAVRNAFRGTGEKSTSGDYDRKTFYSHDDYKEEGFYNQTGVTQSGTAVDTVGTKNSDKNREHTTKGTSGTVSGKEGFSGRETPQSGSDKISREKKNLEDNDVNVHPDPATRSKDRLDQSDSGIGGNRDLTDDSNRGAKDKTNIPNTGGTSGSGAGKAGIGGTSTTNRGSGDLSGGKNNGNDKTNILNTDKDGNKTRTGTTDLKNDQTGRKDSGIESSGAGKASIGGTQTSNSGIGGKRGSANDNKSGNNKTNILNSDKDGDKTRTSNNDRTGKDSNIESSGAGKAGIGGSLATGRTTDYSGQTKSVEGDSNRSDDADRGNNKSNVCNTKGNPEAGAGKAGLGSSLTSSRTTDYSGSANTGGVKPGDASSGNEKSNLFNTKGNPERGAEKTGFASSGDSGRNTGSTSGEEKSNKKDNDVNVHPDPATRSADRSDRDKGDNKDTGFKSDRDKTDSDRKTGNDNKGSGKF